jgi:hypothetical protein
MNVSNIARAKIDILLAISWRQILQQFDLVSAGCFYHCELKLSAFHTRDFFRHLTGLMGPMRKFKAQNVLPEIERALDIRNGDSGMIDGNDAKSSAHGTFAYMSNIRNGLWHGVTLWRLAREGFFVSLSYAIIVIFIRFHHSYLD